MHRITGKAQAVLAFVLLSGCCRQTVPPAGGDRKPVPGVDGREAGIAWGAPADGIRLGLCPVSCPIQMDQDRPPGGCTSVSVFVQNQSCELPKGCDGSVRAAVWRWQVGQVNPGTAGGMGVRGPVDPTIFPLKKRLLDGKVHRLKSYLLPCPSIHPQQTLSGSFAMTFYFTDSRGRPLGGRWRGELRTGIVPVRYIHEPPPDFEQPGESESHD